jgi:Yip1 domain
MNLVERIKGILLQPKSEWPAIEREPGDAGYLFPNYVAIVAAIPAVCTFIGTSLIGYGGYRIGIGLGLVRAVVVYALSLAGVFVVAYIIDFLAGTFGAQKNPENAMRVSAYAPTAAWVAGVFNIIPALAFLGILGLYSLYLLHTGIVALMKPAGQGGDLYDCRHRLRDHCLDRDFRHHRIAVRRLARIRAMP